MQIVGEGLEHTKLHIDDLMCHSDGVVKHLQDLRLLFERVTRINLNLVPIKAFLGMASIEFLGI
ncbi:unnamed protein product [Discosporangium mesarthrocarpum]